MKIIFVTPEFVTEEKSFDGGLSNYIYRTALSLKSNHNDAIVIVTSNINEIIKYKGIEVHRVKIDYENKLIELLKFLTLNKLSETLFTLYRSFYIKKYLYRYLKSNKADIVQYANYLSLGYFRPSNLPVVVRISSFQPELRESYGDIKPSLDVRITEKLDLASMKKADGVYGPSERNVNRIKMLIGKEVKVIENPFEIEAIEYDYSLYKERLNKRKYLLFFGSVGALKGIGTISRVIKEVLALDDKLYFIFVGKDMKGVAGLIESAGELKDRIIWIDKISHEQLYPIIEMSYAVVLPSLADNFPNACLEAMAHSKVVIGTRGTSFEQLIDDGKNGFLIEKDDSQDLLNKITILLNLKQSALVSIGQKAKARVEKISPKRQVPLLIEYYNEILSKFHT